MRGTLRITAQTFLKLQPKQSSELDKRDLIILKQGTQMRVELCPEINGHTAFLWDDKQWFVSKFHCDFVADDALPEPGVELIKKFEGCFLNAYPDPHSGKEPITIGWGCTCKEDGSRWQLGESITQNRADNLLIEQLTNHYHAKLSATIPYWEEMDDNQKGALLSFGYNLGANFFGSRSFNTISNVLKSKQWDLVLRSLLLYRNPGSSVELGLKRRRFAEGLVWQGASVQEAYDRALFTVTL
ncbi:glycoside hydrolase family protein [Nostoc sp. B(2019)]|nr:glycoside hydrolase family protein [Nostoc sp. B(2019)]